MPRIKGTKLFSAMLLYVEAFHFFLILDYYEIYVRVHVRERNGCLVALYISSVIELK